MNREEIFKLIEDNGLTLHGDIEHFASLVVDTFYAKYLEQPTPQLTGVVSVTMPEPIGYLCENAVGHKYFRWKKPPSTFKPIPLYTAMEDVATNDTSQERVAKTSESVHEPVQWGVDWGRAGDSPCVSIIKRLPDGRIEVVAVEYGPQRTWVGLTMEDKWEIVQATERDDRGYVMALVEAKLKEKNT